MIVETLSDIPSKAMHKLIEESRQSEESATTKPIYRRYAVGKHRSVSDATRRAMLGSSQAGSVKENMIGRAIGELNGRIRFREFSVKDEEVKAFLDLEVDAKNQLDRFASSIIPRVLADGSAAASVSWKYGRPTWHHEQWWDGEVGMFVAVSDTGDVHWAVSEWVDTDNNRYRTVYQPHVIERYKQEGEGWLLEVAVDWTHQGRPIGVPVAHFPNGASPYGPYPESTVAKVVEVQDALNASIFNRQVVSAFHGSPQYWAVGVVDLDSIEVGPGKMLVGPKGAQFGSIDPGDMSSLISDTDDIREIISSEFSVPTYRIGQGQWPSGVALVRADAPMIKRCQLLIDVIKPGFTYLAHKSTELANVFGQMSLNESAIISTEFHEPDEIDPGTQVEIDQAKVDLYQSAMALPMVLIKKLELFTPDELAEIELYLSTEGDIVAEGETADDDQEF